MKTVGVDVVRIITHLCLLFWITHRPHCTYWNYFQRIERISPLELFSQCSVDFCFYHNKDTKYWDMLSFQLPSCCEHHELNFIHLHCTGVEGLSEPASNHKWTTQSHGVSSHLILTCVSSCNLSYHLRLDLTCLQNMLINTYNWVKQTQCFCTEKTIV